MKIICETCQSKYTVADEKVQGKTAKIKCKKCGATILVNSAGVVSSSAPDAAVAEPVTGAASGEASYMVNVADGDQRTMSLVELIEAYNTGTIDGETYLWTEGMSDWQPLRSVDSVVAALNEASQGVGAASAEEPAAAPAQPQRAAVRRDPARASADLFGAGLQPQREEVATSAPAMASAGRPGQRDENSMLFSLSALTAKAPGAPMSSPGITTKEDSGLIDLRGLASSVGPTSSDLLPDSAALFPLGVPVAPPPPAPVAGAFVAASGPPPAKSKTPAIVIGAIVALAAVAGAFFFIQSTQTPPPPPPAPAAVVAEPKAPDPVSTPAASAAAPPVETAAAPAASASAVVAAGKGTGKPATGTGGRPAGTAAGAGTSSPGTGSTAKPATPATPKSGGCGCAPGDLMCAMKCSAGK